MSNQTAIAPIQVPSSQYWEGNDGPWSTFAIHLGNPPQPARVLVSTVLGETWVVSANKTAGGCLAGDDKDCPQDRGALFNVNRSTTWQDVGIFQLGAEANLPDYTSEYNNGNYGQDSLGFGFASGDGLTLDNLVIAAFGTKEWYMGNLGVTSRPTNFTSFEDPQASLLSALREQRHIPSLSFGYSAGNEYRLRKVYGSLTLGGYDRSKFTPNDVSFQFGPDISRDLLVGLQSITYNDAETVDKRLLPEGILAFVDSTVPHIWLPEDACTAFEDAFGLEYNSTVDRYLVNDTLHNQLQRNNASVSFILGNEIFGGITVNITLPYQAFDLEVGPPIVNSTTKYFPLRRADNDTQYTLGRTFLQESYLIVDYERSNFSLSQSLFQQDAPERIVPIVPVLDASVQSTRQPSTVSTNAIAGIAAGVVVFLALIAGAVFFLLRRRRRRRQLEEEKRKAEEAFDPMNKPEMDGHSKLPPRELFAEHKLGSEVDGKNWNEMDASTGIYRDADKLRAEMEGTSGGTEMEGTRGPTEMEGTKGEVEMQAGEVAAPVELWAGSEGLYELSSANSGDNGRSSPASRIRSFSGSGRPSPASVSHRRASMRLPFGRKQRPSSRKLNRGNSPSSSGLVDTVSGPDSGMETWSDRPSPQPTPPSRISSPQFASPGSSRKERARRGDDLSRRLESNSGTQSYTHLSVSSPTTTTTESEIGTRRRTNESGSHLTVSSPASDSDGGGRRLPNQSAADRWNERFGSRSQDPRASPRPSIISSPSSGSRNLERRLPPTPLESPREGSPASNRPTVGSSQRRLMERHEQGSWPDSAKHGGGGSGGYRSPSSDMRGSGKKGGGFF